MNIRALVNLDALEQNYQILRSSIGKDVKFCAVVKADAYGHGAVAVSKLYEELGAEYLAVARVSEGEELKRARINLPLLLLGPSDEIEKAIKLGLELPISNIDQAKDIDKIAKKLKVVAKIQITIDSGMGRLGFVANDENNSEICAEIYEISKFKNLKINGIFTHFSNADNEGDKFTSTQLKRFNLVLEKLKSLNIQIPLIHASNSAGILRYKNTHFNMVRGGIACYGYLPLSSSTNPIKLTPAMSLEAKVANVKTLPKGSPIGYGMKYFVVDELEKIITINIGYADGFLRAQKEPEVIVNGMICPVVGRICMDLCMVKTPLNIKVKTGDWVEIFGPNLITAESLATKNSTISYEILCLVSRRVPRVYIKDKKVVKINDYLA
ncbi:MAG: alanine racemase [Campylobacter sp.]|nr:alanine racemase [Campylobacter sp.]